jgi:PqqD family protein of HPr-rel-A system
VTDYPARSHAIDINPVADGYVVYDPDSDLVHYLNHTAAMVLELCDGQSSAAQITALLQEMFADAEDVQASVETCIGQLRGLGLVQPQPAEADLQAQPDPAQSAQPAASVPAQARVPEVSSLPQSG